MSPRPLRALITGGSQGIGLATAHLFARHAYSITLLSRNDRNLQNALCNLSSSSSSAIEASHNCIAGDVSSPDFWSKDGFGTKANDLNITYFDVVVNCAGLAQKKIFSALAGDEMRKLVDVNLLGAMWATRYLIRGRFLSTKHEKGSKRNTAGRYEGLMRQQSPVIINVASLLGLQGGHGAVAYAASKAGVLGFTRALATETGQLGIRINAIVPGYVKTSMTEDLDESTICNRIPLRRFGTPDEIAQAALFLAQNEYAHNCVINIDGASMDPMKPSLQSLSSPGISQIA